MSKKTFVIFLIAVLTVLTPARVSAKTYQSDDEVYRLMKKNIMAHKKEFTIEMNMDTMEEIGTDTDLFEVVVALDDEDTSKDGDYLKLALSQWTTTWEWGGSSKTAKLTFSASYRSTLKQEKAVDEKIESVLKSLDLEEASDYKKVKAIHDYIIERVSYDQTYKKYSAYHALINKSALCEGYALAAYRMFTDAGIDSRIITGMVEDGGHAWNIVKVNGKWYNIDLTWDDPITESGKQILRYDYFLKNDKEFEDHTRDEKYTTKAFHKEYPIAEESYN